MSSSFVCERPRRLWTKTITVGTPARDDLGRVVERPRRQPVRGPRDLADRLVGEADQRVVEEDRLDAPDPLPRHLDVLLGREALRRLLRRREHRGERVRVEVALVEELLGGLDDRGDDPGPADDAARGADRSAARLAPRSRRMSSASFAAPASASRRWSIGVEPEWAAWPRHVIRERSTPKVPSTTPSGRSIDSSTGPCSMCSSR